MSRKRHASRESNGSDRSRPKSRKCEVYKTGKITVNPFLNFVRDVRKNAKGLSVCEIVRKAGKLWRRMSDEQKRPYYQMAKKARELKAREQKNRRKEKRRRDSDSSLSCNDKPLTRLTSQKSIRPKTATSSRSLNRTKSRPTS